MDKLALIPSEAGYSGDYGNEVLNAALAGGPSRTRRDFVGAVSFVAVSWNVPPTSAVYLQAFWRTATLKSSEPFLIDLVLDGFAPQEYQAKIVPGSFRLTGVQGLVTSFEASLEVKPNETDTAYDEAIIMLFGNYGEDGGSFLSRLAEFVNVTWPGDF